METLIGRARAVKQRTKPAADKKAPAFVDTVKDATEIGSEGGLDTAGRALDIEREKKADKAFLERMKKRRAEPGANVPWHKVKKDLGL